MRDGAVLVQVRLHLARRLTGNNKWAFFTTPEHEGEGGKPMAEQIAASLSQQIVSKPNQCPEKVLIGR